MAKTKKSGDMIKEITALKRQFEVIKDQTEDFLSKAAELSDRGIDEAKELFEDASDHWSKLLKAAENSSIAKFFSKNKKTKTPVKKSKKTSKKVASKRKSKE